MNESDNSTNTWLLSREHVLSEIKRLNRGQDVLREQLLTVQVETATLKVKAGIWGLIGGAVPILIALGYLVLKGSS